MRCLKLILLNCEQFIQNLYRRPKLPILTFFFGSNVRLKNFGWFGITWCMSLYGIQAHFQGSCVQNFEGDYRIIWSSTIFRWLNHEKSIVKLA